ncbi:hypothetical protein [Yoonia sp.]|uniref:hypothetical protein n=1 Tax=Yoonia sp. TaxID=2212373 RepID=UPI001A0250EA|nr:hypothetical protein [Yoonia sp.]MBE0413054.1 hypothetical protein [Yoonia sp.]
MTTRRTLLTSAAALGTTTLLPYPLHAAGHAADAFASANGQVTIHPVAHASFVMQTPVGTIHIDPVGDAAD